MAAGLLLVNCLREFAPEPTKVCCRCSVLRVVWVSVFKFTDNSQLRVPN